MQLAACPTWNASSSSSLTRTGISQLIQLQFPIIHLHICAFDTTLLSYPILPYNARPILQGISLLHRMSSQNSLWGQALPESTLCSDTTTLSHEPSHLTQKPSYSFLSDEVPPRTVPTWSQPCSPLASLKPYSDHVNSDLIHLWIGCDHYATVLW